MSSESFIAWWLGREMPLDAPERFWSIATIGPEQRQELAELTDEIIAKMQRLSIKLKEQGEQEDFAKNNATFYAARDERWKKLLQPTEKEEE